VRASPGGDLEGLGPIRGAVEAALTRMRQEQWTQRLNVKDGSLWTADPDKAREIAGWMGWLNVAGDIAQELEQFTDLQRDLEVEGYTLSVLAGMGGSSLCPDVLRHTFEPAEGALALDVLDSTDPSTIAAVLSRIDLARTVFMISSKSGGTTETLSHFKLFHHRELEFDPEHAGHHFMAVTDEGSGLQQLAEEHDFGWVFLNPPDIGGRYSALSYFGMVPAAVMGLSVTRLLAGAQAMGLACRTEDPARNPGLFLGAVLGAAAVSGRDKCTIVCSPRVATLGMWLEQLLAESTGKDGKGIVPVEGEPLGPPDRYGSDRLFVHVKVEGDHDPGQEAALEALRAAGLPVLQLEMADRYDLGGEFLCWEVATAAAGAILGINPFDQPNVQESKDNTKAALERFVRSGDFGVDLGGGDPHDELTRLQQSARPGDYFAVLAYTQPSPQVDAALEEVRMRERELLRIATTAGYGPRYLHSTGQLHKGGPNTGIFLILSDNRDLDIPIPEEPYGFRTLMRAQWVGDLQSLRNHGRRVAHLDLGPEPAAGLERVLEVMRQPV
jgi:glucose-6-phosphate isomerase